jgi:aryl-alcohol dehydrogenase-like predicted oxidoreductase
MNIGENKWEHLVGKIDREGSLKMLDAFYDAGGNFIDTANH